MAERLRPYGLTAALILGLSPSLLSSVEQLAAEPRLVYVVAVWILLGHLVASDPDLEEPRLGRAVPWILAAVAIQILAWAGGFPRFSRFALPFGLVGFLRGVRGTRLPTAAMAFLCVPPPHVVTDVVEIEFANLWAQLAGVIAPYYFGVHRAWDGGVRLAVLATGVTAYRWLRARQLPSRSRPGHPLLALACSWGIALAFQIGAFALAGLSPSAIAAVVFVHASWLLVFFTVLLSPLPGLPAFSWRTPTLPHAH